jgi:hypothetical protein
MTEMVQNQYTKYVKNPNYWDPKLPYLDSLTIRAVKDPMTRQEALGTHVRKGLEQLYPKHDISNCRGMLRTWKKIFKCII